MTTRATTPRGSRPPVWWSTSVAALGLAAGGTTGPLLASRLLPPSLVGLPVTLLVIGSAAAAPPMGWIGSRHGRRRALAAGYAIGALGALTVILAAAGPTPAVTPYAFLAGSLLLGAGNTAIFMSRYAAAAEVGPSTQQQARAIATVLTATSLGAIVSPLLIGPLDQLTAPLGLPTYTGLYAATTLVYAVAATMHHGNDHIRKRAIDLSDSPSPGVGMRRGGLRAALVQLGAVNLLMVAIMTVAPVHLADHGATPTTIGLVVAAHVAAMFGPSPATGRLVSRIGPHRTYLAGMSTTVAAGIVAVLLDLDHGLTAAPALILLGFGWNLGAGVAALGLTWVWVTAAVLAVVAGAVLGPRGHPGLDKHQGQARPHQ